MSSSKARRGRSGRILLVLVMVLGLAFSALPVLGQSADLYEVPDDFAAAIAAQKVQKPYIILMAGDPAIAYDGGVRGYKATKPAKDKKINPNSGAVKKYVAYLNGSHGDALSGIGIGLERKFADYSMSFNGFAAMLTGAEVSALLARDDVLMVWEDELRQPTTDVSPGYLNMPDVWDGGSGYLGEDIVVGVIDTGVWPENPSFSDRTDNAIVNGKRNGQRDTLAYGPAPSDFYGDCQSGEQFSQDDCNNKLIGAVAFRDGYGKHKAIQQGEYDSPRDWDGHGTHTASTAAGNVVTGDFGTISGMAPRARVSMYKACWDSDLGGCATTDLVAAIDTAVADGVDVINYSIGSAAQSVSGPDDVAFLFAADAGVYVATSNGNDGPGANTTGSPSSDPWVTSVGAIAHRPGGGEVDLGDGTTLTGPSLADPAGTGLVSIVDASDHGNPLCYPSIEFVPAITGEAVLCWRGDIARVDKSLAVSQQGGVAMVLANVPGGASSTVADVHSVPSIHIDAVQGEILGIYVEEDSDPRVDIRGSLGNTGVIAGFSSRGLGASSDIIKPDIAAPGVSVLAADAEVTFYGYNPTGVGYKSGTSMASPHIAGIGALMVEAHPDWSPAMIKSALMTTADPFAAYGDDGVTNGTPFETGSGLVQPFAALDPGLVYDAGLFEYAGWTCGIGAGIFTQGSCDFLESIGVPTDPSDLNQPNIAVGELAGSQTVVRTVTNVGPDATYDVSIDAPAGVDVAVSPASLTIDSGDSAFYEVTFTANAGAVIGEYAFGSLTWSHAHHEVTSQIAVRPVQAAFPGNVHGAGESGELSFDIDFGYSGDYTAAAHGLVPASMEDGNVVDDPGNDYNGIDGVTPHFLSIPDGSAFARFSLFDDYTDGADDLDLYVYGPNPTFDASIIDPDDPDFYPFVFVGGSGSGTSAEEVNVLFPEAGNADFVEWVTINLGDPTVTHIVDVHGWQTDGPDSNYTLFWWAFGPDSGNMTVTAPAAAVLGTTETITVNWSGLTADEMYLGAVSHADGGGIFGMTLVEIDG